MKFLHINLLSFSQFGLNPSTSDLWYIHLFIFFYTLVPSTSNQKWLLKPKHSANSHSPNPSVKFKSSIIGSLNQLHKQLPSTLLQVCTKPRQPFPVLFLVPRTHNFSPSLTHKVHSNIFSHNLFSPGVYYLKLGS